MHYALLIQETAADFAERTDPATADAYMGAYFAYTEQLIQAGVMTGGSGLHAPARAITLRIRDGQRLAQDGPFAETKEQLGGFFLIDVPDLATALDWAARCPAATRGSVEVRPTLPPPPAA